MAASPFGFLLPPLAPLVPPELQPETISANQLAYTLPATAVGSHLSIFLLPGQSLPAGSAAALYIRFPNQTDFRFLGALGEGKASAVFRVAGLKPGTAGQPAGAEVDMDADAGAGAGAGDSAEGTVTVGISLEPTDEVAAKVAAQKSTSTAGVGTGTQGAGVNGSTGQGNALVLARRDGNGATGAGTATGQQQPSTKVLAQRIIKNAFNFLASFEAGDGKVPIKAFEGWWQKFERKVENDPTFLEREQD